LNHLGDISLESFLEINSFEFLSLTLIFEYLPEEFGFVKIVKSEHLKSRKIITLKCNIYFGMKNENI